MIYSETITVFFFTKLSIVMFIFIVHLDIAQHKINLFNLLCYDCYTELLCYDCYTDLLCYDYYTDLLSYTDLL